MIYSIICIIYYMMNSSYVFGTALYQIASPIPKVKTNNKTYAVNCEFVSFCSSASSTSNSDHKQKVALSKFVFPSTVFFVQILDLMRFNYQLFFQIFLNSLCFRFCSMKLNQTFFAWTTHQTLVGSDHFCPAISWSLASSSKDGLGVQGDHRSSNFKLHRCIMFFFWCIL